MKNTDDRKKSQLIVLITFVFSWIFMGWAIGKGTDLS